MVNNSDELEAESPPLISLLDDRLEKDAIVVNSGHKIMIIYFFGLFLGLTKGL